jgi:hypothetical protein
MSSLLPHLAIVSGHGFLHLSNQGGLGFRHYFIRWVFFVYIIKEQLSFIPQNEADKLVYTLFHDRSPAALDMTD